jgi:hypothetical protein
MGLRPLKNKELGRPNESVQVSVGDDAVNQSKAFRMIASGRV